MGFYPFAPTIGNLSSPLPVANGGTGLTAGGSAGQVLGISGGAPAWTAGITLLATTGTTGYTLVNGTGTVITWTAPNDSNLHRVQIFATLHVTSNETGGTIQVSFTDQAGGVGVPTIFNAGTATGTFQPTSLSSVTVKANTAVSVTQASALTAGAAVLYAEIWGS